GFYLWLDFCQFRIWRDYSCAYASGQREIGVLGVQRREFRDTTEQGIDASAHFTLIAPLFVKRFLQHVNRFQANIDNHRRWFKFSVPQTADKIFNAMGNGAQAFQADLCRRALQSVDSTEKLVNFFRIIVAFQRNQAVADDLQMVFSLWLEKFKNLVGDVIVQR